MFLGATIALPIVVALVAKRLWFRREDEDIGDSHTMRRSAMGDPSRDPKPPMK